MDDAWLHTIISAPATAREKSDHRRRRSTLLQQLADEKADLAVEPVLEAVEENDVWHGPPKATLARRAQSYSDFYHVVRACRKRGYPLKSKRSLDLRNNNQATSSVTPGLDFEDDMRALEHRLLDESHMAYTTYHEQLEFYDSHLDNLLVSTTSTLNLLSTLSRSFRAVEAQTDAFREQCENLVTEQQALKGVADAIDENMRYYAYLEPITRRLNAPGATNLVMGNDFPQMLSNLDNCLAFMESHPNHKQSGTYHSRYRLLLTRGLTLIRHHFTKSLGEIAADISKRIHSGQLKETTHSALLYAKFRVPAPELKALGLEIQKRAVPTPEDVDAGREPEYLSLLRELYQSYSATRGRLILPLVSRKMTELATDPQQADIVEFGKTSIGFLRGICLDEYDLWFEWFESEGALYEYLESLMEPVFDHLRPRTIHETKIERLCDLCATIQGRYMDAIESDEDGDNESAVFSATNGGMWNKSLDFANLVQPALADAQTRLVFLALNILRDGIENYKPKSEDLEFARSNLVAPNGTNKSPVLSGKRNPTISTTPLSAMPTVVERNIDDDESFLSKHISTGESALPTRRWYPTLQKAIWLLRRIYRLVNSSVFDDLAHRVVHSTIASVMQASHQVRTKKTTRDSQLFLIVHLLQLKQQIVAFDIEFIPPEVEFDFSSVTNTFYELRDRGSLWSPTSWVQLVSGAVGGGLLPKVVENMLDAKAELDGRLRAVINDFVDGYATHIIAPVEPTAVAQQQKDFDPLQAVRTVRGLAEKDVPELRAKLEEFIDDARTRETLVAAVRDQVITAYEEFFDNYSEGTGKRVSRKGKAREDEIWGADLFSDAMEQVFQVGQVMGDEAGSEGGDNISD